MATKKFSVTRDFRYGTRMLRAGDTVDMTAPQARLYTALKAIGPLARQVAPKPVVAKPQLDHDGDGKAGGSPKGPNATRKRAAKKKTTPAK